MPLRAAFTGRHDGPELGLLYRVIEPHRLHRRLAEFTYTSN
jgi:glutamyl-tRNA synthetase